MRRASTRKQTESDLFLTQEQRVFLREHFSIIDRLDSGYLSYSELGQLLRAVGEQVTEDQLELIRASLHDQKVLRIDVLIALRVWSHYKQQMLQEQDDDDNDILNAFVAMGGNSNKTGLVLKQTLIEIIKNQFGLTIDLEMMMQDVGLEGEEELTFADFNALFGSTGSGRSSRVCSLFSMASSITK